MNSATKAALRSKAHKLKPLLDLEEPFTIDDVIQTNHGLEFNPQNIMFWLSHHNIIEKVGEECHSHGNYHNLWRWTDRRDYIQEIADNSQDLPCGCRGHIPDMRESPEGIAECKHCGTTHSRETFKESL